MNPPTEAAREEARILLVMRDAELVERYLDDLRRLQASFPEGSPVKAAALAAVADLAVALNAITKLSEELVAYSPAPAELLETLGRIRQFSSAIEAGREPWREGVQEITRIAMAAIAKAEPEA